MMSLNNHMGLNSDKTSKVFFV